MPRNPQIKKVMVIGSGPIVIGQACEFDYSGTQAVAALKAEGIETVLLNANPATVMTDPERATRTYVEPITVEMAESIIAREKPDSLLPTMGGQTALNLAKALAEAGILERHGVKLIGASLEAIEKAEDRLKFREAMERIGAPSPKSAYVTKMKEAEAALEKIGFPVIIRPSFTLGGQGGGVAEDHAQFVAICENGFRISPTSTLLIEESLLGWKEYELEVVRDRNDNVIIVCSIENLDPMGVHTGDSITVAPAQTLSDREYQYLRELSKAIIREIGVDTGGSNVQFAVNPKDGRVAVIEMNPRVSRSSALASKATGYPIAKVAARLAVGYTLDEIKNDITGTTTACFEPAIDYVVVKIPRFNFDKFPKSVPQLTTSMRSVGEVMAIGRTFSEAYFKAIRSLETPKVSLDSSRLESALVIPNPERPAYLLEAFRQGMSVEKVHELSAIDPFFLRHIQASVARELKVRAAAVIQGLQGLSNELLLECKRAGASDADLAQWLGTPEAALRSHRWEQGIRPVYKRVDTCASEFHAATPYLYSTYEQQDEAPPTDRKKVVILGSGPVRIGQGIEFDYVCVHACQALRAQGIETVMINCNPETVSTDYDTSDRLYFEPLTLEDVLEVVKRESPIGVIVQLGGQTPLKLAQGLHAAGVPILGTSVESIDRAEDRKLFNELVAELGLKQAQGATALDLAEAKSIAMKMGYPLMVRPSYVLGGRAMQVVRTDAELEKFVAQAFTASPGYPVLLDRYLENAIEVDVDLVADATGDAWIAGVLEHVEPAGVHSGDAGCVLPPYSLSPQLVLELEAQARKIAKALGVVGLQNVQFAVQGETVFVLEVNPRASRTVPFIAKATGVAVARVATLCMAGVTLESQGLGQKVKPAAPRPQFAVKESVFPFNRFPGQDYELGPEMRSTGEVMGVAPTLAEAFAKAQLGAGVKLSMGGVVVLESHLAETGLKARFEAQGFRVVNMKQVLDREVELKDIRMMVHTLLEGSEGDGPAQRLRKLAIERDIPLYTTLRSAELLLSALAFYKNERIRPLALQELGA